MGFVFVMVVEIELISVWGIERDLISVYGWNWFGRYVGGRKGLITCMLTENDLFWYEHENWLDFCVVAQIDLISV